MSGADDNVRLEWIEHGLGHLVLAGEGELGPVLQAEREDVDQAVRLIIPELTALAVADKQELGFLSKTNIQCQPPT